MIYARVRYGVSYGETGPLTFKNKRHLIDHLREPWAFPCVHDADNPGDGSDVPRSRYYYPVAGDWETGMIAAVVYYGDESCEEYPDAVVEVGPRGGLRLVPA